MTYPARRRGSKSYEIAYADHERSSKALARAQRKIEKHLAALYHAQQEKAEALRQYHKTSLRLRRWGS